MGCGRDQEGAQDAEDTDNAELRYSSSGEVPTLSTFIQNARSAPTADQVRRISDSFDG